MKKSYIALFTCATSRMLHLELCPDLTTEAYIRSQKRMMGRKRSPALIVSDNGRTFKGKALKKFNAEKNIRWRFNLSRAPWWGGMFERMIKSVKRCLKKAIGSKYLTYEELETILIEVEAVLNSRPLTYQYEESDEVPLTPSHLFSGERLLTKNDIADPGEVNKLSHKDMVKIADDKKNMVDHFWSRWHSEYLVNLREQHKLKKTKTQPIIEIGEVVLIKEDKMKRNRWKLGKIENLIRVRDGVI